MDPNRQQQPHGVTLPGHWGADVVGQGRVEDYGRELGRRGPQTNPHAFDSYEAAMDAEMMARGSHASLVSEAGSDRSAGTDHSNARKNDSAVKMAVRAAAAQVQALQKESRSRARVNTPEPLGTRRPNVEV
jgi:hypothetical protein